MISLKNKITPVTLLLIFFLLSIIVKLFICLPFQGPILFFDEFLYKENALYLTKLSYFKVVYPPLYPLCLTPGFLFSDFYTVFKIINIVLSSLIIFPVYLISKEFLTKKKALFICILSLLLPYHFVYNKMIMSENLYYPLCLLSFYFVMRQLQENKLKWSILSGVGIVLCILTRYFGIILFPIYGLLYLIDWLDSKKRLSDETTKQKLVNAIIAIGIPVIILTLLFIPNIDYFFQRGSKYSSDTGGTPQIIKFFGWLLIYTFYAFTFLLPFIPLLLSKLHQVFIEKKEYKYKLFLQFILFSSLFYIAFAALHSSIKAFDNTYLNGRYIIYIGIPLMIFCFIPTSKKIYSIKEKIVLFSLSILLLIITCLVLSGYIFNTAKFLLVQHMSPDGYLFMKNIKVIMIAAPILYFILIFNKKDTLSMCSMALFQLAFVIFAYNVPFSPIMIHGHQLLSNIEKGDKKTIYNGTPCLNKQFNFFMRFWESGKFKFNTIPIDLDSCSEDGYLITNKKVRKNNPITTYMSEGCKYYIFKTPIKTEGQVKDNLISSFSTSAIYDHVKNNKGNPYAGDIALIEPDQSIFSLSGCDFSFDLPNKSPKKVLYCQFGFMPQSKQQHVSDGMHFSVIFQDSCSTKKLIDEFMLPTDDNKEIEIAIPETSYSTYKLTFSTFDSKKNRSGDWGCWNTIDIDYYPK